LLRAADFHAAGVIDLGSDADNVWVDAAGQRFFVGHGDGAIAVIDAANRGKARDIPLRAHPEAFRPSPDGRHLFVNVPDAHEIAVIDLAAVRQTQSWPTPGLGANFPMALSSTGGELWVAFRQPATIAVLSTQTGARLATLDTCADADEVLLDARRSRLYVSCGEGQIDVLEWNAPALRSVARIATRRGARTALFAAETDRLYLAVPASGQQPAAIWVYRPGQQ
jgi:DNA-binding beta-propeller fold protein YncE